MPSNSLGAILVVVEETDVEFYRLGTVTAIVVDYFRIVPFLSLEL